MPSSTSSSERAVPAGRWGRTWALTLVLAAGAIAAWESAWRAAGHAPSVEAVDASWILALDRVEPDSTVVLGTSRIQAALDPRVWAEAGAGPAPVQLALPGNSPLPLLEHLAGDGSFHGLVLVEVLPMFAFDATDANEERGAGLLAAHDAARRSPSRWSEAWMAVHVGGALVFRNPRLTPLELARTALRGERPNPSVATMRPDRFAPVGFQRMRPFPDWSPQEGFAAWDYGVAETSGEPADPSRTTALLERLEAAVARLRAHGARVVALRLPACGERARIEERRWPRARYWDRLAASTSALPIHLGDEPAFPRFDCYDGSHLDAADAPAFTRALRALVAERLAGF